MKPRVLALLLLVLLCGGCTSLVEVVVVREGKPVAAIFVPERIWDNPAKMPEPNGVWRGSTRDEGQRIRLRESVRDMVGVLERITGAKIEVRTGAPKAGNTVLPILIAELAEKQFGAPQKRFSHKQGFRIVATPKAVGLSGESDLAVSYAIYTLLDQLGCRWYMPGPMGEVLPRGTTLALAVQDFSSGPHTTFRGLWYCDNDFARRNRMGGLELSAGHALETSVPNQLRVDHPEVRAIIGGKPDAEKLKWTHPLVADALATVTLAQLKQDPTIKTFSLSPMDGIGWDESDDTKYDHGDFDPSAQTVSKTDRLMLLSDRVARKVCAQHPDVLFGILAYVDYTRPPVKQAVHPNVVPEIAPITYSRAHPMTDDGEPNNRSLRHLVTGWGKVAPQVSYYFYSWFLAEPAAPSPFIRKWSVDIPLIYQNRCKFWQPETISNFESSMHAHYLGLRMAWHPAQSPKDIIAELHQKFYGNAAAEMAAYWHHIDDVWVDTPEYSGCGFGYLRRFTPVRMAETRRLMDRALAAARTAEEKFRIALANDSLKLFEQFMAMRRELADGRWAGMDTRAKEYQQRLIALCDKYGREFAFGRMGWTGNDSLYGRYFSSFYQLTYDDAARVARDYRLLTPALRDWRYQVDSDKKGEAAGWGKATLDDATWKATDVCHETWSSLGLHNYMGALWYRRAVDLPAVAAGKKIHLWIGATDGRVKVFVNGQHVLHGVGVKSAPDFSGYCQPTTFDITAVAKPGAQNQISLLCTREFLNELGTGGLLAPVAVYADKD